MKKLFTWFVVMSLGMAMLGCSFGSTLFAPSQSPVVSDTTAVPLSSTVTVGQAAPTAASAVVAPQPLTTTDLDTLLPTLYQKISPGVVSILKFSDQGSGLGSGLVYDTLGNIVTNYHVVQGATHLEVNFVNGLKTRATLVGSDLDSDLAVIKVNVPADQLKPLILGNSDQILTGQQVIAMGNPFGLTGTMTEGIVSAKGRMLESLRQSQSGGYFSSGDNIQTDAAINPGNSGGPLINLKGEVVGINRMIQTTSTSASGEPTNSGIGFAIPINMVKRVVPVLIASGKYDYPYLGLSFNSGMGLSDYEAVGLKQTYGAYIVEVIKGGPGEQAGLKAGSQPTNIQGLLAGSDLVTSVDGRPVLEFNDLIGYVLENKLPGDKIALTVLRDNQKKEVVLTLGKRP
jgi:S1-C subfamily serine protease